MRLIILLFFVVSGTLSAENSWLLIRDLVAEDIRYTCIDCFDENNCIAAGSYNNLFYYPYIEKTTDGGLTWESIETEISGDGDEYRTNVELDNIHYFSDGTVYAKSEVRLLKSENYGETWTSIMPLMYPIRDISFIDSQTGIMGYEFTNAVLKTTDGGATWDSIWTHTDMPTLNLYCVDKDKYYVFSNEDSVFVTENGGISWDFYTIGLSAKDGTRPGVNLKFFFLDSQTGWIGNSYQAESNVGDTQSEYFSMTTDGGETWSLKVNEMNDSYHFALFDYHFIDENNGYACGNDRIACTTDGGATWEAMKIDSAQESCGPFYVKDFAVLSKEKAFATASCGMIFKLVSNNEVSSAPENSDYMHFPNPFGSYININSSNLPGSDIFIYDMLGKPVYSNHACQQDKLKINTEHWVAGPYILKFAKGAEIVSRIILKN